MAITTAKALAVYIMDEYRRLNNGKEISPLKLQKALYFCFAYWGGFVRKGKTVNENLSEIDISNFDEELFEEDIEAWVYGPVVPEVYKYYKQNDLEQFRDDKLFKKCNYAKNYIDGILKEVLNTSDFTLVDIAHRDNSWKNNFDFKEMSHNNIIPKEEIIEEYVYK